MFDYEFISELLQSLLLAVLPVLAAAGAAAAVNFAKDKRAELDQKNQWMLDSVIRVAVFAAQQVYGATNGPEKKAYALDIAEKWLASKKIYMDLDVLDAAIEAAVFEQLKRWEEGEPQPPLPEPQG